jgi:hypothetical protein
MQQVRAVEAAPVLRYKCISLAPCMQDVNDIPEFSLHFQFHYQPHDNLPVCAEHHGDKAVDHDKSLHHHHHHHHQSSSQSTECLFRLCITSQALQ